MKDLTIELEHRPGALAEMGETPSRARVSLEERGARTIGDRGLAHFMVPAGDERAPEPHRPPDPQICKQALLSRDPRFDGLFVAAVPSTGIYCRPVCPIRRTPRSEHVRYFPTATAAESAGFRPCLRCRPELCPEDARSRSDATVARALRFIDDGFLAMERLSALAARVGVGERHLRRLFVERLGITPPELHRQRRLLLAKKLLTETSMPIIEVAMEAGFGSLRRFNACIRNAFRMAPSDVRRGRSVPVRDEGLKLRLAYRPPYCFATLLDFLRPRALPGLELVDDRSYARAIGSPEAPGWLRVSPCPDGGHALRVEIHGQPFTHIQRLVARVRRMFDLDADMETITATLGEDAALRPLVEAAPGLRLPGGWDGFEVAVRAVLGEGGTAAEVRAAAVRLLDRYGQPVDLPSCPGLGRAFPRPVDLVDADLEEIGLGKDRAAAVRSIARALLDRRLDFRPHQTLEEFVADWSAIPGIGPGTAHSIALSALGHPDAFPADRSLLRLAMGRERSGRHRRRGVIGRVARWRPWRAYALVHLWRAAQWPAIRARPCGNR